MMIRPGLPVTHNTNAGPGTDRFRILRLRLVLWVPSGRRHFAFGRARCWWYRRWHRGAGAHSPPDGTARSRSTARTELTGHAAALSTTDTHATHARPTLTTGTRAATLLATNIIETGLLRTGQHGTGFLPLLEPGDHPLITLGTHAIECRTRLGKIAITLRRLEQIGTRAQQIGPVGRWRWRVLQRFEFPHLLISKLQFGAEPQHHRGRIATRTALSPETGTISALTAPSHRPAGLCSSTTHHAGGRLLITPGLTGTRRSALRLRRCRKHEARHRGGEQQSGTDMCHLNLPVKCGSRQPGARFTLLDAGHSRLLSGRVRWVLRSHGSTVAGAVASCCHWASGRIGIGVHP